MSATFDLVRTPIQPGLSVIEASAGTGKTYAISHLVARLLLEKSAASLGEVVLVTYTNDAARELAARVRRVFSALADPPARDEITNNPGVHALRERFGVEMTRGIATQALLDLDLLNVSTLHSFCQRVLQTEGTLCGMPVVPELITDATEITRAVVAEIWETQIARDPVLSLLATRGKWDAANQTRFVNDALAIPGVEFVPAPRPFEELLAELRAFPAAFTSDVCTGLGHIWSETLEWNATAPSRDERSALLATLANSSDITQPDFLDAAASVAASPGWITSRKNKGKELRQRAEAAEAVRLARALAAFLASSEWHFQTGLFRMVRERIDATLTANRQITYDGLITGVHNALSGPQATDLVRALRTRFKIALIDESQDTDARQFDIFRRVFCGDGSSPHRLVLIGDPKQAIYAFRGADVNTYLAARDEAGDRVFSLGTTFRSPEPLVRATNALFSRPQSFLKPGLEFQNATSGLRSDLRLAVDESPASSRLEMWIADDSDAAVYSTTPKRTKRIAGAVASEIVRLLAAKARIEKIDADGTVLESRAVRPGDFAVLVSDGKQAREIAQALTPRGVPAIRAGTDDIMTSSEASDLLALMRAMLDPRHGGLRRAALATTLLGRPADEIAAAGDDDESLLDRLLAWNAVWERDGIAAALGAIDREENVMERLASLERGERCVTNLRQLIDLLESASHELGRDRTRLARWLAGEIASAGERTDVTERQQQLESDAEAVQIVTMHASKGLEYPLVFCPFLWSSRARLGSVEKLARRGEPTRLVQTGLEAELSTEITRSHLEDRLRLVYVAVTRAKVKVWIQAGEVCGTKSGASALDWILRENADENVAAWMSTVGTPGRGARHQRGFEALVHAAGVSDVVSLCSPPVPDGSRWGVQPMSSPAVLRALEVPEIPPAWEMTSFSALTREKNPHGAPEEATEKNEEPSGGVENPFFDAPGGTLVGTAVHEFIERWDFSSPDADAIALHCRRYPLPDATPSFAERLTGMLRGLRSAVLPGAEIPVSLACPEPGASEWHFQLPLRPGFDARAMADIFERHGMTSYASRLSELPAEDLFGYLHGFIDRITFHNGAWGVIDWKTNRLGESLSAYDTPSLIESAMRSHYLLQTHLYLVALRRFTPAPLAGAWLVFVRAVQAGTSSGILHISPSPALLDDLDALFSRPQ